MQLSDLVTAMEEIAPTRYAEAWDNVGLLVGDPEAGLSRLLLTIDYTLEVAEEARRLGCDAVLSYHPPLFQALKRVTAGSLIFDAVRRGIGLYSPHTALDVAEGGTNDLLADVLELEARAPLRLSPSAATHYKLVVFVPEAALEAVRQALFAAGAGHIGDYSSCSFHTPGTGTFFGETGTQPAVGQAGRLEAVPELRLETVLPIHRVGPALEALRKAHPYEEPAFDLVQLAPPPVARGLGRIGRLPGTSRSTLLSRIKAGLGIDHLLVAGPTDGVVTRAAVGAGACGDLLDDVIAHKAQLYLTGEMRHHDALKAARAGLTVVCTRHSNSERAVLSRLAARLEARLPGVAIHLSQVDRDPFEVR